MSCITIDSGNRRITDTQNNGAERQGIFASLLRGVLSLVAACRSGAALAMMSERELDDLGLLPWEVRSGTGAEEREGARQPKLCHQT